jgi:hypothetical protein
MSLDREDIRAKLDPDLHRALKAICDAEGCTIAEFVERVLAPVIRRRVHEAIQIADAVRVSGRTGNSRETSGTARNLP